MALGLFRMFGEYATGVTWARAVAVSTVAIVAIVAAIIVAGIAPRTSPLAGRKRR